MTQGKKPTTDGPRPRGWRGLIGLLVTFVIVAGVVWGIKRLGDSARDGIATRERYSVFFGDIECNTPPGLQRAPFLAQVRFVSKFPQSFQSLDPELSTKLSAAFTKHPWVAAVEDVSVEPPATVRVKLKFRVPALALRLAKGGVRVVDSTGVLLPQPTDASGLPELLTPVPPPTIESGLVWPDETVKRAVELVEAHHPRKLEKTATGWRLTIDDEKVIVTER